MYDIDRGIPAPTDQSGRLRYPWPDMGPGDSIVVPPAIYPNARSAATTWCQRNRPDLKVVTRKNVDGDYRLWFVEREDR